MSEERTDSAKWTIRHYDTKLGFFWMLIKITLRADYYYLACCKYALKDNGIHRRVALAWSALLHELSVFNSHRWLCLLVGCLLSWCGLRFHVVILFSLYYYVHYLKKSCFKKNLIKIESSSYWNKRKIQFFNNVERDTKWDFCETFCFMSLKLLSCVNL